MSYFKEKNSLSHSYKKEILYLQILYIQTDIIYIYIYKDEKKNIYI